MSRRWPARYFAVNPGLPDGLNDQPGGAPRTRISGEKSLSILHKLARFFAHLAVFALTREVADEILNLVCAKGFKLTDGIPWSLA